jgi:mannosyltransferase
VRRREVFSLVRSWAITTAVATVMVIPFALATMGQSKQLHWLDPLGDQTFKQVFVGQWFMTSERFAIVGWILLAAGALVLLRRSRRDVLSTALLLSLLLVPTLSLLAATEFYLPIYTPRYLTMGLPFVALIIGVAIAAGSTALVRALHVPIKHEFRWMSLAAGLACVLLATLAVPQIIEQRQPEAKQDSSWSQVAELIAAEREADGPDVTTAIVWGGVQFHPIATARVIAYSYPEAFEGTVDVTLDTPAGETGRLWETTRPLGDSLDRLEDADVVYIIASFARDIRADATEILLDAGWRVDDAWDKTDVHVVRFVRA